MKHLISIFFSLAVGLSQQYLVASGAAESGFFSLKQEMEIKEAINETKITRFLSKREMAKIIARSRNPRTHRRASFKKAVTFYLESQDPYAQLEAEIEAELKAREDCEGE